MRNLFLGVFLFLSACCTIVDSPNELVTFNSNIDKTKIKIINSENQEVYVGQTPTTVMLNKKAGYFSGETYRVRATQNGYAEHEKILETRLNGWYWGNILVGGLIGMLLVDPATGAMWTFEENNVLLNLEK